MNFLSLLHSSYMFSPSHFHYKYPNNTRWYVNITTLPSVSEISAKFLILPTVLKIQTVLDVTLFGLAYKCLLGLGSGQWRHQAAAKCWWLYTSVHGVMSQKTWIVIKFPT
jgi:hypothetical protein